MKWTSLITIFITFSFCNQPTAKNKSQQLLKEVKYFPSKIGDSLVYVGATDYRVNSNEFDTVLTDTVKIFRKNIDSFYFAIDLLHYKMLPSIESMPTDDFMRIKTIGEYKITDENEINDERKGLDYSTLINVNFFAEDSLILTFMYADKSVNKAHSWAFRGKIFTK